MAMQWQTVQISLGNGVNTKQDVRASTGMDIARDCEFEQLKGTQTRHPMISMNNAIVGGGNLANCRRVERNGDELLVFTSDSLYSWNETLSKWSLRGTHLAISAEETPRCVTPGDQIDGDRAELNGTMIFVWTEATTVFASAIDKATGSVLVSPTAISTAVGRPRLVTLDTRILLFVDAGANNLTVRAIDPASPGTAISGAGTSVAAGVFNSFYDVERVSGQDYVIGVYRRSTTTSYSAFICDSGLVVTTSTKARTADGPLAVSSNGTVAQIVRANSTNIQGDLITVNPPTMADVFTAQAIGTATSTTINQVTVAFANATTAYAFWTSGSLGETSSFTDFTVKFNTATTANVIGTQATFRHQLGIASRAFTYNGHVYVWLAFASDSGTSVTANTSNVRAQLQNAYYLYRDDITLASRCVFNVGGGFAASSGRLPAVSLTSGSTQFSWCATARRRIQIGGSADHTGFGSRSPRDVVFTFDSNDARQCSRLGSTLYITGGIPLQYDGTQLAEIGYLVYPWYFEPQIGGAGAMAAATYTWKATMRWQNAQGEVDRSTTATGMVLAVTASKFVFLNYVYLYVTMKNGARPANIDMWRTVGNPPDDSPFYLVTSQDPNAGIVTNGFVTNIDTGGSLTPLPDNFTDAILQTKEENPENGTVLEYLAPPGARIITATDTRVYLSRITDDPNAVWYSRLRVPGEVISFHDGNVVSVPPAGGRITAFWFMNDALIVARETSIYGFSGNGFDNSGGGQNLGPATWISHDVGAVSMESVVLTPAGAIFKSRKGWYLMDRGWNVRYIGAPVVAFDNDTILAAHIVEDRHQVRILTNNRLLMWDYFNTTEVSPTGQWAEWTISDGIHATVWNGSYVYLTSTGPKIEASDFTGVTYGQDIEISWQKFIDLQGWSRVRWVEILGECMSSCLIRVRMARDYQYDAFGNPIYYYDKAIAVSPGVLQERCDIPGGQGQCEAIKVRITAVTQLSRATLSTFTDLSPHITTSGSVWNATFQAADFYRPTPGEMGNNLTMSFTIESGSGQSIDIRDNFRWDVSLQRWVEDINNIGVRAIGDDIVVADLESAISDFSSLVTLTASDPSPLKVIAVPNTTSGNFSGGAYGPPTGEAIKLTGLGFEIGVKSGLYRRLPAGQKQ